VIVLKNVVLETLRGIDSNSAGMYGLAPVRFGVAFGVSPNIGWNLLWWARTNPLGCGTTWLQLSDSVHSARRVVRRGPHSVRRVHTQVMYVVFATCFLVMFRKSWSGVRCGVDWREWVGQQSGGISRATSGVENQLFHSASDQR